MDSCKQTELESGQDPTAIIYSSPRQQHQLR